MRRASLLLACVVFGLLLGGCEHHYAASADREVDSILRETRPIVEDQRPAASLEAMEKLGLVRESFSGAAETETGSTPSGEVIGVTSPTESEVGDLPPRAIPGEADVPTEGSASSSLGALPAGDGRAGDDEEFEIVTPGYAGPPVPQEIRDYVAGIRMSREEEIPPALEAFLPEDAQQLTLAQALELAVKQNRNYQSEVENRYLEALDLTLQRHDFNPIFFSALSSVFSGGDTSDNTQSSSLSAGVSDVLPTGGGITISGSVNLFRDYSTDSNSDSASYGVGLVQPLLQGAGYMVSHESLTQQQRNVIYEIRDFELFRQDFTRDIARSFWNVILREQRARNIYDSYKGAVDDRKRSEAQLRSGLAKPLDVMRQRVDELRIKNNYIDAVEQYLNALDALKIQLGLPTDHSLALVGDTTFDYTPVSVDPAAAIEIALANRMDLMNADGSLEDAERRVRIAANGLLPEFDLAADWESESEGSGSLGHRTFSDGDYSVRLDLEIPVDRTRERNSYRRSLIDQARQKRSHGLLVDQIKQDVRDVLRELRTAEETLKIQAANMYVAKRRLEFAQILFEQGKQDNRDIVEARDELVNAQNTYAEAVNSYKNARLSFMREAGILLIDQKGMWIR